MTRDNSLVRNSFVLLQGVGDVWTDPQFHTSYPTSDFGKGNLEQMGIDGFFKSHKCNSICEFLGIGKVSPLFRAQFFPFMSCS